MVTGTLKKAFGDELVRLRSPAFTKTAWLLVRRPPDHIISRLIAAGALSSGALHGVRSAKAGLTGDYGPEGTFSKALSKGAIGGLIAALGLKGMALMANRRRALIR